MTKLGAADGPVKRKILGENSARLYRYPVKTAFQGITGDQIALIKTAYQREGIERKGGSWSAAEEAEFRAGEQHYQQCRWGSHPY